MSNRLQDLMNAATAQRILPSDIAPKTLARPWPVILMTGLGAWLAALPILVVLFLLFGDALENGPFCYVFGAALLYSAVLILRSRIISPFIEQLGLPVLLVGGCLLALGLFRDLPYMAAEALLLLVIVATAWTIPQHWLRALLGALAAAVFILMSTNHQNSEKLNVWSGILAALVLWLIAAYAADTHVPSGRSACKMILLETMSNGWILATLAALAYDSGATLLSPATLGHWRDTAGTPYLLAKAASGAMAIAGAAWLGRCWPALRAPRYAFAAAILAAMSWLIAGLGAALLVLAVCVGSGRWRLAVASAVAASWIVGTFYYQTKVPLATKAAIMATMGLAFGLIAWFSWNAGADDLVDTAVPASAISAKPAQWAGVAVSLLLTLLVANGAIWQKEALISTGRPVFIPLAPVDPRSLMQGDYMALNFQLPSIDRKDLGSLRRAKVIAKIDRRGVAVMQDFAGQRTLAPDEILIELVRTGSGLRPAADGWYFKEGEALRWSRAKYGEFRIDGQGRALLVNLRGAALEPL